MEYVSIKQISEKWGICARRVQTLCTEGRIEGAQRVGHQWIIPADAPKPKDARVKSGKYIKSKNETSLDKGTQRKTTENELPSLTQCTA